MSEETGSGSDKTGWERDALRQLAGAALQEQRRSRRWSVFFRLAFLGYLLVITLLLIPKEFSSSVDGQQHTAVVRMEGVIASKTDASAKLVIKGLKDAFEDKNSAAVVLKINSPGGSPVQAGQIHDEMLRLRKKYPEVPLYTVIDDVCASGGYYVAVASDRIFADKASIVGSIGVLMNGFGFVDAMTKLGVERRLLTAGQHKGFLDPFSPVDEEAATHVQALIDNIHRQFIDVVKAGRGDVVADDPKLFSGLVWSGEQSLELGLVDQLASLGTVAREVVKTTQVVDFTVGENYIDRFSRSLGASVGEVIANRLGITGSLVLE